MIYLDDDAEIDEEESDDVEDDDSDLPSEPIKSRGRGRKYWQENKAKNIISNRISILIC